MVEEYFLWIPKMPLHDWVYIYQYLDDNNIQNKWNWTLSDDVNPLTKKKISFQFPESKL